MVHHLEGLSNVRLELFEPSISVGAALNEAMKLFHRELLPGVIKIRRLRLQKKWGWGAYSRADHRQRKFKITCSVMIMKTAWLREEISFILVDPVARMAPPRSMSP